MSRKLNLEVLCQPAWPAPTGSGPLWSAPPNSTLPVAPLSVKVRALRGRCRHFPFVRCPGPLRNESRAADPAASSGPPGRRDPKCPTPRKPRGNARDGRTSRPRRPMLPTDRAVAEVAARIGNARTPFTWPLAVLGLWGGAAPLASPRPPSPPRARAPTAPPKLRRNRPGVQGVHCARLRRPSWSGPRPLLKLLQQVLRIQT